MATAKKLINDPANVVLEMIEGLVETYPNLQYLDGFPEIKVVLRADVSSKKFEKVALISGGGSGHEPAHASFVGAGMLTAAVCGDVFASPTVTSILAAIRAVTGAAGCLLIVKNYTGDRLNFGLAAEQARAEGYKVQTVIVGDDCALPPPRGLAGRRGLAGTIFVHKVAGAAAEAGLSLADVAAEARHVAGLVGTMGVGLTTCTLPGGAASERLGPNKIELGLGIHGEPGAKVADLQPADTIVAHLLNQILDPETAYLLSVKPGSRVALLVNSLGGTPTMEVMVASGKAVAQLQVEHGLAVARVYAGAFMTSLDMAGISLSILKVDDNVLARLDAPTRAPAWPNACSGPRRPTTVPVPLPPAPPDQYKAATRPREVTPGGKRLEAAIRAGAEAVLALQEQLNAWDALVGDGDCGSTMAKGARAVLEGLSTSYPLNDEAATVREIGATLQRSMGGTSGVLYTLFCGAAFAKLKEEGGRKETATHSPQQWAEALGAAVEAVSTYGGAAQGYRTMLDALIPASAALQEKLREGEDPRAAFRAAGEAAEAGAESTKTMLAQAGRSMYVPAGALEAAPDPGAKAAAAWLRAAARALSANEL